MKERVATAHDPNFKARPLKPKIDVAQKDLRQLQKRTRGVLPSLRCEYILSMIYAY